MSMPWIERVRTTGILRVHRKRQMVGDWHQVVGEAIDAFNTISAREHLGVTFVNEPDESRANVIVWTVAGTQTTTYSGTTNQVNLAGNASRGHTTLFSVNGRVEMAHVFLPATPGRYRRVRALGRPVRLVLAFHELVHACGLHDSDHGDLAFHGTPSATRARRAGGDRVSVLTGGQYVHMPPLVISNETCWKILFNWVGPHLLPGN